MTHGPEHYNAHNGDHEPPPAHVTGSQPFERGVVAAAGGGVDLAGLAAAAAAEPLVGEAKRVLPAMSEDEWYEYEAGRGELGMTPEQIGCFECGGFDGKTEPLRTVVGLGGVVNPSDPTQTYRLVCGHVVI